MEEERKQSGSLHTEGLVAAEKISGPGVVYIIENPAMPGYVKIGLTNGALATRIKQLYNTSVPLPFKLHYAARVADAAFAEARLHEIFEDQRAHKNREFFQVKPEKARAALLLAAIEEVKVGDEQYDSKEDKVAVETAEKKSANFEFSMIGLEPGTELQFAKDPAKTCIVHDNKKVMFEGEVTSLSDSALTILHRMGYEWGQVQGTKYWMHQGKSLHVRLEAEAEE